MLARLAVALMTIGTAGWAQDAGQTVTGVITAAALRDTPRRLSVRLDDGAEVEATLADRTRVTFTRGLWSDPKPPHVSALRKGMTVQFKWGPQVDRVRVLAVPPGARPGGVYEDAESPSWGGAKPTQVYEAGRELTGRVLDVNVAAGTLTVEVEGRSQTFLADPRDLRALGKGARVVLVTGDGGRLTSVRPARP